MTQVTAEHIEYQGIWWIPDKPEIKLSGTLRINPYENVVLEVVGYFEDITKVPILTQHDIILGKTVDGRDVTLSTCIETHRDWHFPGFSRSSFNIGTVFIGAHFPRKEDQEFKKLFVSYQNLDEWVNISGFQIEHKDELVIRYKSPEAIRVHPYEDWTISLEFQSQYPTISLVQKEACVSQRTYVGIASSEMKPFEEYLRMVLLIRDFISLGIGVSTYPIEIKGITEHGTEVRVFYPTLSAHSTAGTIPPFMLFTFKDIADRWETLLRNWFKNARLLEPVYNLYFGTFHNPHLYLEHQFLSIVQALESYHRRVYGGKYVTDEEYNIIMNHLVEAIPPGTPHNLRDRLKTYLKYGNEFSLRKRLKEIVKDCGGFLEDYLGESDKFIDDTVNIRNYLTHYDGDPPADMIKVPELYRLTLKLKLLVMVCLLKETGFETTDIDKIVKRAIHLYGL